MKSTLHLLFATCLIGMGSAMSSGAVLRPASPVNLDRALADAQALTAGRAGFSTVRVEGESMLPFFGNGSVLVVKQIASASLREGMVVVYRNRFGETVAHRITGESAEGWIVQGYNNRASDSTRVNDSNLVGVVYATFQSNGEISQGTIASAAPTAAIALAAPAR